MRREYKVIDLFKLPEIVKVKIGGEERAVPTEPIRKNPKEVEDELNEMAKQGYRLCAVMEDMIIMEKEAEKK